MLMINFESGFFGGFFCSSFRYSEGEIRFNLMAIVSDRKMIYEQRIAELQQQLAEVGRGI